MDGIQALFLSLKLKDLDKLNSERRRIAAAYLVSLAGSPLEPLCPNSENSVWHAFVCKTPRRKELLTQLDAAGIGHAIYYPKILPELPIFRGLVPMRMAFPGAKALSKAAVSIPLYPGLAKTEINRVTDVLRSLKRDKTTSS
jgi:dTDP-4-amino-4,6-dideoxygalactose transaminase